MTDQASTEPTVLLVDDNAQNLKVLYETLKDRGYRLLIANDGEKALSLAQRHHPEVILLDIMMPDLDGYQVCERLKADPTTADSAVVFLSALDDVDAKLRGFSSAVRITYQSHSRPRRSLPGWVPTPGLFASSVPCSNATGSWKVIRAVFSMPSARASMAWTLRAISPSQTLQPV